MKRKRNRLRRRYGRGSFGIGADPDYVIMYGSGGGVSHGFALLEMAIDEARALSKPSAYGGEVFVVERRGPHTREVGVARNGRYTES